MNEQEFLQQATSKIYNFRKKQAIVSELHDHIVLKENRYKEIGYSDSEAEEKSLEEMGDAQEIAKTLGELHKSYNSAPDIILLLVFSAVLYCGYFLEKKFIFGDPGALSMLICGIIGGVALFFLYAAYASSKKHPAAALCAFAAGAVDGYYQYNLAGELSRLTDGDFNKLKNFIANNELYFNKKLSDSTLLTTIVCIACAVFAIIFAIILIYSIKKSVYRNSSFDNRVNRVTTVMCIVLFAAGTIAAAGFGINTFNQIAALKSEYKDAFEFAVEAERKCSTQEELAEFLKNSDYDFGPIDIEENKYYTYSHNLVYLTFELYEPSEPDENSKGFKKLFDDMYQKGEYAQRYVFAVNLGTNNNYFDNGYDSLTLSTLKTDESVIEALYKFKPYEHTAQEKYEYFLKYMPTELKYSKCCRELVESSFEFRYIEGTGDLKDTNYFEFSTETQALLDFKEREQKITEILKNNNSTDPQEIARITDTTAIDPNFTNDEYTQFITELCDYAGKNSEIYNYKEMLLNFYPSFYKYSIYDDWYFYLFRFSGYNIVVFDNDFNFLDYFNKPRDIYLNEIDLNGAPVFSTSRYNIFSKISINGGFFDKKGLFYDDAEKIRYYTENGSVFRYHTEMDYDEPDEDNMKKYYLIDNHSKKYPYEECFIDKNGWLVINDDSSIQLDKDGKYKNDDGEVFTPVFETSWDENGNVVQSSDLISK